MEKDYVVVIGGLNIDLAGICLNEYKEHDSNMGEVNLSVGGVGRNIAANLTKLAVPNYLISVYGDDYFGTMVEMDCQKRGIRLDYSEKLENEKTSIYLYINDDLKTLVSGVNDMKVTERITPEFLSKRLEIINGAKYVVLDTNLSEETINWIGENVTAQLVVDTVSYSKASRVLPIIDKVAAMKLSMHEAQKLTDVVVQDEKTAKMAAQALLEKGVGNVLIPLGRDGLLCANKSEMVITPSLSKKATSINGTSGTVTAAMVYSWFNNGSDLSLDKLGLYCQAASSISIESLDKLSCEELVARVNSYVPSNKKPYRVMKQIYSIVNYNEAVQVMDAGADHIGLVPQQSGGVPAHRVHYDVVDKIFAECKRRGVKAVAIMLNKDVDEIIYITKRIQPDILHIAGMEYTADAAFAQRLHTECPGVKLMQAVLVDDWSALDRAKEYAKFCDIILTDSGLAKDTGIGASGLTHDWAIDAAIVREVNIPVIIAGGLGPANVEKCIREIRPYGVDSLTKTSFKFDDGVLEKNIPAVKEFCDIADRVCAEINEEE